MSAIYSLESAVFFFFFVAAVELSFFVLLLELFFFVVEDDFLRLALFFERSDSNAPARHGQNRCS